MFDSDYHPKPAYFALRNLLLKTDEDLPSNTAAAVTPESTASLAPTEAWVVGPMVKILPSSLPPAAVPGAVPPPTIKDFFGFLWNMRKRSGLTLSYIRFNPIIYYDRYNPIITLARERYMIEVGL